MDEENDVFRFVFRFALRSIISKRTFCSFHFVSNQDIKGGEELCISYIESEHLCENSDVRTNLLDMDFKETAANDDAMGAEKMYPIIDLDMQDELMSMHPI